MCTHVAHILMADLYTCGQGISKPTQSIVDERKRWREGWIRGEDVREGWMRGRGGLEGWMRGRGG